MFAQFAPAESQRRHWRAIVIGCVPDHVPGTAVRVEPTSGCPEMDGGVELVGAVGVDDVNVAVCVAVAEAVMLWLWPPPSDHDENV
jgi:hypothetical protein